MKGYIEFLRQDPRLQSSKVVLDESSNSSSFEHVYIDIAPTVIELKNQDPDWIAYKRALQNPYENASRIAPKVSNFRVFAKFRDWLLQLLQKLKPTKTLLLCDDSLLLTHGGTAHVFEERLTMKTTLCHIVYECLSRKLVSKKLKVVISATDTEGEADTKIFRYMLDHADDFKPKDRHLIVSSDSDMFLLSLLAPVQKIFISRPTVTSIEQFSRNLVQEMNPGQENASESAASLLSKMDFIALCFLSGNDYLPPVASNVLFTQYMELRNAGSPFENRSLVRFLAPDSEPRLDLEFLAALLAKDVEQDAQKDSTPSATTVQECIFSYLSGLLWCLDMYFQFRCMNNQFAVQMPTPPPSSSSSSSSTPTKSSSTSTSSSNNDPSWTISRTQMVEYIRKNRKRLDRTLDARRVSNAIHDPYFVQPLIYQRLRSSKWDKFLEKNENVVDAKLPVPPQPTSDFISLQPNSKVRCYYFKEDTSLRMAPVQISSDLQFATSTEKPRKRKRNATVPDNNTPEKEEPEKSQTEPKKKKHRNRKSKSDNNSKAGLIENERVSKVITNKAGARLTISFD